MLSRRDWRDILLILGWSIPTAIVITETVCGYWRFGLWFVPVAAILSVPFGRQVMRARLDAGR